MNDSIVSSNSLQWTIWDFYKNMAITLPKIMAANDNPKKKSLLSMLILSLEFISMIIMVQYWWWGMIYSKSTVLLFGIIAGFIILSGIPFWKQIPEYLTVIAIIIYIPCFISVIAVILARFAIGISPHSQWFYQNVGLMIVTCLCGLWIFGWKLKFNYLFCKKADLTQNCLWDLVLFSGFAIILTNFNSIVQTLFWVK
jgi:hypothetical protein